MQENYAAKSGVCICDLECFRVYMLESLGRDMGGVGVFGAQGVHLVSSALLH